MKPSSVLKHEFVESLPRDLEEGTIYISIPFATVGHKCCCGCGREVITPLSPTDWELTFDGETVSLDPSIGNWSFSCRSHYWIVRNQVRWARPWSEKQIERGRKRDRAAKESFFIGKAAGHKDERTPASSAPKRDTEEEPRST